ncbi:MAG: A/G-specific adenine glycosylase [Candidatus Nanopelagicales bacterium]|jgi:A/G-specific adenine glycosylase|nr:A/G-specific adenine glycosylase [Candidatus Nanopelagicales bacterium]
MAMGGATGEAQTAPVAAMSAWYLANRRDLPWRAEDRTPWGVLVSEVMLQQTQVARVLPAWQAWMARWPQPAALAEDAPGEAVRQWDRLGYPRRALRLHAASVAIVERHGGVVPEDEQALRALPGVGEYTAAAVRAFAFGRRALAMDTNVRRVLARLVGGVEHPPPALTVAERRRAEALLPDDDAAAALWSIAVMELGAVLCTARAPACQRCPVAADCAWLRAGRPAHDGPPRRSQRFAGTDRQVRGLLMAVLREQAAVSHGTLQAVWAEPIQRERALDGLVADGLVEPMPDGRFRLPGRRPSP